MFARRNDQPLKDAFMSQVFRQDLRQGTPGKLQAPYPGPPPAVGQSPTGDVRMQLPEARDAQQKMQRGSNMGRLGSLVGGLAGTLIPIPILGPAIGSAVGGGLGQLAGGLKPDFKDILGYGASGAIGGAAGAGMGAAFGQGAGRLGQMLPYMQGQAALGGLGLMGVNTQYDPAYRYFYNPNNKQIQTHY